VVLPDRGPFNSEAEPLSNRAERLLDVLPDVRIPEWPPPLRGPDQMVFAVVLRTATRAPARAGSMVPLRTATKGQDKGDLRPAIIIPGKDSIPPAQMAGLPRMASVRDGSGNA